MTTSAPNWGAATASSRKTPTEAMPVAAVAVGPGFGTGAIS
jgi:hypothetical protein